MTHVQITDTAILVGFAVTGECVYSASIPLDEYWDGEHVWDDSTQVKKLQLEKVFGFLFGQSGNLLQQFESTFDINTGIFKNGWARHEDDTFCGIVSAQQGAQTTTRRKTARGLASSSDLIVPITE